MRCSPGDARPSEPAPFRYNPFEIAVCGWAPSDRAAFLDALAARYASHYRIGRVVDRGADASRRTSSWAADSGVFQPSGPKGPVTLTMDGERNGLAYPADCDAHLRVRPLLDADVVFIDSEGDSDTAKLVLVGEGAPEARRNVLAYVGRQGACPFPASGKAYCGTDQPEAIVACIDGYFASRIAKTPVYGLVLAGGRSTRMKTDKASLEYHGKPQAMHAFDLLSACCERVWVSVRPEQADREALGDVPQLHDAFLGFGPLGGILSALKAEPSAAWLALACDLPFVDGGIIRGLLEKRNPFKLATAFAGARDGLPEPLCAVYEPKSVYRLMEFLARGHHCPRKALLHSDTQSIEAPSPFALDNVNRPEDYAEALEKLEERRQAAP